MTEQLFTNYTTGKVAYSIKDVFMNAAEKLFLEKGVDATSVTDILALTKKKKSIFYNSFNSKSELQAAMRLRYDRKIYSELLSKTDKVPVSNPKQQLKTWIESYIELYINSHHIYDIVYDHSALNRQENQKDNPVLLLLIEIIDNGNIESTWQVEEPKLAAMMIKAGIQAIADDFLKDVFNDYRAFYQTIVKYCLNILK